MISPLRGDVLGVAFVLALPMLAFGLRGDLSAEEVVGRLPWCLVAGWGVVALLRFAATPRHPAGRDHARAAAHRADAQPPTAEAAEASESESSAA